MPRMWHHTRQSIRERTFFKTVRITFMIQIPNSQRINDSCLTCNAAPCELASAETFFATAVPLETFFVLSIGNKQPCVFFQVHKKSILDSRKAPSFTVKEGAFGSRAVSILVARVARHNSYTQPHKDFPLGGRCQSVNRSVLLKSMCG